MGPKKDKKKKEEPEPEPVEEVIMEEILEPELEEVQFTDTSYTSASFESLPPMPEVPKDKDKKKKKKKFGAKESTGVEKANSELVCWSEESLPPPPSESELPVIEEQVEEKKPKKGKKGKGKKEVEEIPDFEKPKNWKKMNKKEREAWLAEQIEMWRAEKEAEKQRILAGAKEKRATLARERNELMARDVDEQDLRRDLLKKTTVLFQKSEDKKIAQMQKKQEAEEWAQYLRCDGLPDPRVVTQVNTYLHLWQLSDVCDADFLEKKCAEVMPIIALLEQLVQNVRQFTPRQINNYNEVRMYLRSQLAHAIQMASYYLLRDLEKNLKFESTRLATYGREFYGLRLNIWVAIKWPTKKPKPNEPEREAVELSFPSMKVTVKLPKTIDATCVCVRAARSMIDLLSESSRSFGVPGDIPNRFQDLFTFNDLELKDIIVLKKEQEDVRVKFYKEIGAKITELERFLKANPYTKNEKEKDDLDNLNMMEPPFMPDPRTHLGDMNEKRFQKYLKECKTRTRAGEINLRKYRICGGVLNLDLLTTPPQPKRMRTNIVLSTFVIPKALQPMNYQVQYRAPAPPPPGVTRTPEEIELEIKKVEAQYQKLAQVFIDLPQDVMWTEPPVVCQWQEARKLWTTNYVNDYKFNEDKLTVQFRTGVLWPIGIAALKYGNLPYQGWDIKPDPNGKGVLITVTGVSITVTWLCLGNTVRLQYIANATTSAMKEHFFKPYTIKKMVQLMREAGCDFFPTFDAHNHIEGTNYKEWVMERHTYHAMAFMSRAYNFQWSRWNNGTGSRIMIFQLREAIDTKREAKLSLAYVTPQRTYILKGNEMMTEANHEPAGGMPFFADLFTLNLNYGSVDARRTTFNMKYRLVETVSEMLQELKVLSFS